MNRAQLRTQIRQRIRDNDESNLFFSNAEINQRIDWAYQRSPLLRVEIVYTETIDANQIEFDLPANMPRFSQPYRVYLRDTSSAPNLDFPAPAYRIFAGKLRFGDAVDHNGYQFVMHYFGSPDLPENDTDDLSVLADEEDVRKIIKPEQEEILRDVVAMSLLAEDPRPTWEVTKLMSLIQRELDQNIEDAGLTTVVF